MKRPTPRIKIVLRVCTFTAVVFFVALQVWVRRRLVPPKVVLKSAAEQAKLVTAKDSHPCFLLDRSPQEPSKPSYLQDCRPSLNDDHNVEQYEVDLRYGQFILRQTDLFINDNFSLALTRNYALWDNVRRAFGIGANHAYDIFMVGDTFPYTYVDLILGDDTIIHYDRISQGTGYADSVTEHKGNPSTIFDHSRIQWNSNHWDLKFRNGAIIRFPDAYRATNPEAEAVVGMRSPEGDEIGFLRDAKHDLTRVTSPHGHWIQFEYDSSNRITKAEDDAGRSLQYVYNQDGTLAQVLKQSKILWRYTYDRNGMTAVEDSAGKTILVNRYWRGYIASVTLENGQTFHFDCLLDKKREVTETVVTDPAGSQRTFLF
jgi:YD repeat-containing protein